MHSANAARKLDESMLDDATMPGTAPPSEHARYEPRYRVVTRRAPTPAARRRGLSPLQRTLVSAVVPTACLLVYVLFWTLAMRGGFVLDRMQAEYDRQLVEHRELQAEVRRRQAPGVVLPQAEAERGLQPGVRREFKRFTESDLRGTVTP